MGKRRPAGVNLHTADTVMERLMANGIDVLERRVIDHGVQFRLADGGNVNVYRTGSVLPQGANASALADLMRMWPEDGLHPIPPEHRTPQPGGGDSYVTTPAMLAATVASFRNDASHLSRRHPDWSDAPWDGVSVPF